MNEEEVIYRAAKNAMNAIYDEGFIRKGELAEKAFGNRLTGLRGVIHWFDNSMLYLQQRLDEAEKAVRAL